MEVKSRRAFTLVELAVALAVACGIAALAIPAIQTALARGRSAKCIGNLRQIGAGLSAYLADHDQRMPVLEAGRSSRTADMDVIDTVLADYVGDPAAFSCPADPRYAKETGTSYYWNVALNGQRSASLDFLGLADAHTRIPVVSDKEGWHPVNEAKINILYADGHAAQGLRLVAEE